MISEETIRKNMAGEEVIREDVLRQAASGDNNAFTQIYSKTHKVTKAVICRYCDDKDETEDLLQDTYIEVYLHLKELQDPKKLQAWICQIAAHKAIRYLKKKKPEMFTDLETEDGASPVDLLADERPEADPYAAYDRNNLVHAVGVILSRLPEVQRITLDLVYAQGYKITEVAEMFGVSENTVKSRLFQGSRKVEKYKSELQRMGVSLGGITVAILVYEAFCADVAYAAGVAPGAFVAAAGTSTAMGAASAAGSSTAMGAVSTTGSAATMGTASSAGSAVAGAAIKTAAGTAAKGIGVKIAVAVTSAVLLAGGGAVLTQALSTEFSESLIMQKYEDQLAYFLTADLTDQNVMDELQKFTQSEPVSQYLECMPDGTIRYPSDTGENVLFLTANGVYRGEAKNGMRNGYGFQRRFESPNYFDGTWLYGVPEGFGTLHINQTNDSYVHFYGYFTKGIGDGSFMLVVDEVNKTMDVTLVDGYPQAVDHFSLFGDLFYPDTIVIGVTTLDNGTPYTFRCPKDSRLTVDSVCSIQ